MIEGMKVLSFSHFVQGPAASQYLADLGADVTKVEPFGGAWERRAGSAGIRLGDTSVTFLSVNRNKKSIAVDLKHPDALRVLRPLIGTCDVLMENYRGGALEKLGLGYEAVREIKPDIIYASATGWGSSGPMAGKPGVDLLVQARSGLISVTGDAREGATAAGTPVADHHGAALLAMGVLAAYVRKLATGRGTRVQSSLLGAGLDLQAESLALYYSGGKGQDDVRRPGSLAAWFIDPPYGVYRLLDAHAVIALSGAMDDFAAALGSAELAAFDQEARRTRREEYTALLARTLAGWTYRDLAERLEPRGFWIERVATYDDVRNDPQVAEEGLLMEMPVGDTHATVLNHPIRYDGRLPELRTPPPELGEHTRPALREAGFGDAEIDDLIASGVVASRENGAPRS
ncbi:CaiB/BaiF CoA transferase family protein [Actinomadura rugatobispora]|uniref:CaiB/BaiF CoA transferase family protein n=1 Tax=Actinomadura rugatobispora TaxID=1994 RepID=A0ABW0ZQX5_9ACTN|nr:CoA transferase [Actinomadura rugatobispora]